MAEPGVASRSGRERQRAATRRPALKHGDRLGRDEFERRYALRPDLKKAQLIEGVVYLPSPVSVAHSEPHAMILGILLVYSAFTPGVRCYDNATVRLDLDHGLKGRHHESASQCHDPSPRRRMPAGVETAGTHRT